MKNDVYPPHQSSIGGLNANVMALLCYVVSAVISWIPMVHYVAWLVPLVLFFVEKQSRLVKFHAMQSVVLHAIGALLSFLVSVVLGGIIGASMYSVTNFYAAWNAVWLISIATLLIALIIFICVIYAMVGAYRYKETYVPLVGGLAQTLSKSLDKQ